MTTTTTMTLDCHGFSLTPTCPVCGASQGLERTILPEHDAVLIGCQRPHGCLYAFAIETARSGTSFDPTVVLRSIKLTSLDDQPTDESGAGTIGGTVGE